MGRFLTIIGHSKTSLTTVLFQQYVSRAAVLFFCFTFFLFVVFFFCLFCVHLAIVAIHDRSPFALPVFCFCSLHHIKSVTCICVIQLIFSIFVIVAL